MFVFKRGTYKQSVLPQLLLFAACLTIRCSSADICILDGRKERVQFDKITARVSRLCYGLDPDHVDPAAITMKVISGVYHGVTTIELDNLVRETHISSQASRTNKD